MLINQRRSRRMAAHARILRCPEAFESVATGDSKESKLIRPPHHIDDDDDRWVVSMDRRRRPHTPNWIPVSVVLSRLSSSHVDLDLSQKFPTTTSVCVVGSFSNGARLCLLSARVINDDLGPTPYICIDIYTRSRPLRNTAGPAPRLAGTACWCSEKLMDRGARGPRVNVDTSTSPAKCLWQPAWI